VVMCDPRVAEHESCLPLIGMLYQAVQDGQWILLSYIILTCTGATPTR
jgi:hypothetical protein